MCYYDQDVYAGCKCRVWGDFRRECDVAKAVNSMSTLNEASGGGPHQYPVWCNTRSLASEIRRKGICLSCENGFEAVPFGEIADINVATESTNLGGRGVVGGGADYEMSMDTLGDALRASASGFHAGHRLLKPEFDVPSSDICSTDQILARSPPEIPDFNMDVDIPPMPGSYAGPAEQDISWLLALNEDIDSLEEYISNREGDPNQPQPGEFDFDPSVDTSSLDCSVNYDPLGDPNFEEYFDYDQAATTEFSEEYEEQYEEYEEPTYIPAPRRSRKLVVAVTRRFHLASRKAHSKLLRAGRSNNTSHIFKHFVRSLGSHSSLVKHGFENLDRLLSGFSIHSLQSVYSFLHVAYAMSMTDPSSTNLKGAPRCQTYAEFKAGLDTLRECLDDSDTEEAETERELFDEIVSVMWDELDQGIAWFGRQTGWPFSDWCDNAQSRIEVAREGLKNGTMVLGEVDSAGGEEVVDSNYDRGGNGHEIEIRGEGWEEGVPEGYGYGYRDKDRGGSTENDYYSRSWLSIVTGTIFLIVVAFLRALDNLGEFFAYLSGRHGQDKCLGNQISCDLAANNPFRRYFESATSQFVSGIKEHIVDSLTILVDEKSKTVLEIAMDMVNKGMISTLRDFENYVVGLSRIVHQQGSEHVDFVFKVLWQCTASSERIAPPYRVKRESHAAYDETYISARVAEEDVWHCSTLPPAPTPPPAQAHHSPAQSGERSPSASGSATSSPSVSSIGFSRYAASGAISPSASMSSNSTAITTPNSSCSPTYPSFSHVFPVVSIPSNAPTPSVAHSASVSPSASIGSISVISSMKPPTNRKSGLPKPVGQKLMCDICGMTIRGSKSSSSKSNLLRHKKVMHDPNPVLFECGWPGCSYRQKRKDNVKAHRRKEHGCK